MMNAVFTHSLHTDAALKAQDLESCRYPRGAFMEERLR